MWVRPKIDSDLEALTALEEMCFTDAWSANLMSEMFAGDLDEVFVLEDEGQVIGYGNIRDISGDCDLMSICVRPDRQGQGGGSLLMERILAYARGRKARQVFLEVRRSNAPAQALYRKFGFQELGVRKNYYTDPQEDALVMQLLLQ